MLTSKELYDRIEKLRIQKGLSVAKLNTLAGISHSTLSSWKQRGTMPTIEVLESLGSALGVSVASLLYDVEVDKLDGEVLELISEWKKLNKVQKEAIIFTIKNMN